MKIWIDMLTPKQVLFFEPVSKALKERGDEIIVTSRRYREVELMIRKRQIKAEFIGSKASVWRRFITPPIEMKPPEIVRTTLRFSTLRYMLVL